jgi:hypothetical protein
VTNAVRLFLSVREFPYTRRASTPGLVTAADGRRQIGSTPAGGDVRSTDASCGRPEPSPQQAGRTRPLHPFSEMLIWDERVIRTVRHEAFGDMTARGRGAHGDPGPTAAPSRCANAIVCLAATLAAPWASCVVMREVVTSRSPSWQTDHAASPGRAIARSPTRSQVVRRVGDECDRAAEARVPAWGGRREDDRRGCSTPWLSGKYA